MPIVVNLDVMLAKRKMSLSQLSEQGKDLLDQRAGRPASLAPEERG